MFSTLFNAKTNMVWQIVGVLHTGKEMVHTKQSVVRVVKKWIQKPSSTFTLNFAFGLKKCPKRCYIMKEGFQRRMSEFPWLEKSFKKTAVLLCSRTLDSNKPCLTICWSPCFVKFSRINGKSVGIANKYF